MSLITRVLILGAVLLAICPSPSLADEADKDAKKATVATIAIKGDLPESPGAAGLFGEIEQNLADMIRRLDRAAEDNTVDAVVLKLRNPAVGRGRIHELRSAIGRVREKDKRVVAELQMAMPGDYLIAAACDEVVMPESGFLVLPGVRAELTYLKGLFEKIGVQPDFMQIGKYKGAKEPYTREGMSPEFRRQFELVIDDFYNDLIETIAADRKMEKAKVKELIDQGLFTAKDAQKAGLIDRVAYDDQLDDGLKKQLKVGEVTYKKNYARKKIDTDFSGLTGFMKLMELMMGIEPSAVTSGRKKIAVVYAVGPIMTGSSQPSLFGGSTMGSDTIVKALRTAAEDKTVVAIVLRVDSPGGSAVASDMIWREIQQIEKPVYASMGDTAASGGYYISMGCDKIYAEPGTLTGSIGVVGGKLVTKKMFGKVGITSDVISRGKNSGLFSGEEPWSDSERAAMMKMMRDIYDQFTSKAAAGRKIDPKRMESLAQGRLWSGRQAQANGLVDEVGTLRDALKAAKKEAGLKDDEKAEVMVLPKPKSVFEQLLDPGGDDAALGASAQRTLTALAPQAGQHLGGVELWQKLLEERVVLMLPYRVTIK